MSDEGILFRIKREWTQDESVKMLLIMVSELKKEIGMLKSDLAECKHEKHTYMSKVSLEGTKTKKEWLKDELIASYDALRTKQEENNKRLQKSLRSYQEMYFALIAKNNKE
jgi:hypothetical protein